MGAVLSRGATQLRMWLAAYFEATLPPMIAQARTDWSLQSWQLPDPQLYDTYDMPMVGFNKYPAVGADFPNETNHVRTDFTDRAEPEYWSNQTGAVYVWVATPVDDNGKLEDPYRESCLRLRDDFTELVRQALLVTPSLGQGQNTCWLEETSVNVNKMDPWRLAKDRADWVAGASISVVYRVKSELCIVPLGTAETIDVTYQKLEDA